MIMDHMTGHMTGHMVTTTAGAGAVTAFVDSSCGEMHQSLTQPFSQYPVVLMSQYSSFTPVTPDHTVIQLQPVAEQGVKLTGDSQTCSLASDIGGPGAVESTEAACVEGKDSADDKLYMLSSVVSGPPTYIPISCPTTSVAAVNYDPTLHGNESPHPTGLTEVNDVGGGSSQCCWDDPGTASQSQAAGVSANTELYVCEWTGCGKTFSVMEDLVNHVNDMHVKAEQDVIYKCCWKSCPRKGKGFNARYKMLIHVRTHTNEKPHKCKECSKTFSRLENLKIHHRSHTGEKPYICPFEGCTKAYSNSSDRFKHVQTHKTVKPYICRHHNCKKSYTDPSSLRKHIKIHGHYDDTSTSQQPDHNGLPSPGQSESVSASGLLSNINLSHIITLPGQTMSLANLAANPFLSSAVYSSSQCDNNSGSDRAGDTISSMPCSPVKELFRANSLHQDLTILVEVASNAQDSPLDLTTTPSPTHTDTIEL